MLYNVTWQTKVGQRSRLVAATDEGEARQMVRFEEGPVEIVAVAESGLRNPLVERELASIQRRIVV